MVFSPEELIFQSILPCKGSQTNHPERLKLTNQTDSTLSRPFGRTNPLKRQPANPRSHANVQIVYSISCFWKGFWQPFLDLINSKDCTHEYKLLNFSDLKKVAKTFFKNAIYQSERKHMFLTKEFGSQCHIFGHRVAKGGGGVGGQGLDFCKSKHKTDRMNFPIIFHSPQRWGVGGLGPFWQDA